MLLILSLIEDDQRRDRLAELYKLYKQPMMDIAADILHNGHDAEDAVHTVFLNIATKRISILDDLSDIQDLKYYLLASARNAAVNMLKANNRTVSLDENTDTISALETADFIGMLCDHLEYEELVEIIKSIPSPYREALHYRYNLEMRPARIARLLNRSVSTVKKQLVRGKKMLINEMTKRGIQR